MQFPDRETVARIRAEYPSGTRIELLEMADVQAPPTGTKGTVLWVDDVGDLCTRWDTGASLKVVLSEDVIRKIDMEE